MAFSAAQEADLRQPRQAARWYLGIYNPPTVLACRINDADITKGDRLITYDGVSEGAWGDVEQDMMMYVGSAAGKADYGRIRAESITASVITVAENDDIEWANNQYLTIVRFWEPLAIYPRQIYQEDTDTVLWYKRYSEAYANQNYIGDPVPCMGGHFAGFVDHPSGVYFDAADSYDPLESVGSFLYEWDFPEGTPTGSVIQTPGYIQYGQAGQYTAALKLTNADGKWYTGYRHIMLFDRPGEGPNRPFTQVEFQAEIAGDKEAAGFDASFIVDASAEDVSLDNIRDGALCIVFAEEWFGSNKISYGQHQGREHIVFVGYIMDDSIAISFNRKTIAFTAQSVLKIFGNRDLFPVALDYTSAVPTNWYQMYEMTVDKAVYHFLMWHTTMYRLADTSETGDTKLVQFATFGRQSVLDSLRKFLQGTIGADACADAQGTVHIERDNNLKTAGNRSPDTLMRLIGADWRDQMQVPRFWENKLSQIEVGGVNFYGPNIEEDFEALMSVAPGHSPAYSGNPQSVTGYVVSSQTSLNAFSGRKLAQANNKYANLAIPLSGNYRCLPLAPQMRLYFDTTPDWDPRGSDWNASAYFIQQVRHLLTSRRCLSTIVVSAETDGPPGETIIIPEEPPWEPTEWPPPPEPVDPPPTAEGTGLGTVYVVTSTHIGRTTNFDEEGGASWADITGALTGTIYDFVLDPWDPANGAYVYTHNGADKGGTGIWYCSDLPSAVPTWTLKYTITQMETDVGQAIQAEDWRSHLAGSINEEGYVGFAAQSTSRAGYWHTHDRWDSVTYVEVHRPSALTLGGVQFDLVPHLVGGNIWVYYTCEAGWGFCPQGDGRVEVSKDGGHTFAEVGVGCIDNASTQTTAAWGPISCPYEGNEDGQIFYLCTRPTTRENDGTVYKSIDGGVSLTAHKPGVAGPALFDYYAIQSHTYDHNRVFLWDAANKLWVSNNGMTSWIYIGDGDDDFGFVGDVVAAGGFPYNDQLFYALAGGIYYSLNRGSTWRDATGDWADAIGAFGTGRVIVPLWTE